MSAEQPEALRLADLIDSDFDPDWMTEEGFDQIAAELRRLHSVNADLLAALNTMLTHMSMDEDEWNKVTFDKARAAIAKATGDAA